MKIAIVTPQAVPLVLGGAENLWWGLQDHFNMHTEHTCDIISVPAPEGTFWDLMESYETFSKLDVSAYDCVISGKYPAWMVDHPNHICYMLHRLRGVYDTYNAAQHDASILGIPKLLPIINAMRHDADPDQVDAFFNRLRSLRDMDIDPKLFAFPGPFSRAVVHFLDDLALSTHRIKKYAAISQTVAARAEYFPQDVAVDVLYPPPHQTGYHSAKSQYFFTSSRLDKPKRLDLLIRAMKLVKEDVPLWIAGSGPEKENLKTLAGDDRRIKLLGYVPDEQMIGLYANALAVPFVPQQEDYGLITLEAMKSAKAVLTVTDSGGPCEFVEDGETGYVCPPNAKDLAKGLSKMAADIVQTQRMGAYASKKVEKINWANVVKGLLEQPAATPAAISLRRLKLTVASVSQFYPPLNGGQARVFHLYRNLARHFDIDIVCLGASTAKYTEVEIRPGLVEIVIPKSEAHAKAEHEISAAANGIPVNDIVLNTLLALSPAYGEAIELSALASTAIVASHPYMIDVLKRAAAGKPIWYEAQNVELNLKKAILEGQAEAEVLLGEVSAAEKQCWITADRVFACATRDLVEFERVYGPTRAHLHEVPNGVSLEDTPFTSLEERQRLKKAAGIYEEQIAIFVGSWHGPNLEAIEDILVWAPECPDTRIFIIGSAGVPFRDKKVPQNVEILGAVSMEERDLMFSIADAALNPMQSGSGTNLKMLDYMAAGIPVISTSFGARGLEITPEEHFIAAEKQEFSTALKRVATMSKQDTHKLITRARQVVETQYSWAVIADNFAAELGVELDAHKVPA